MALNLMDLFKDQIGNAMASQASKYLGVSENNVQDAMGGILPALMGGLINKGSTESGAAGILDFMNQNKIGGGLLDNLGGLFGGGSQTDSLASTGSMVLKFLMGDKTGAIVDLITRSVGIKSGVASSLLKMAAPMLLGLIGKQVSKNGLNAGGLMKLLLGQRDYVRKSAPAGLGDILGFADWGSDAAQGAEKAASAAASSARETVEEAAGSKGFNFWPWLIGLGLLAALWMWKGPTCKQADLGSVKDKIEDAGKAVGDAAKDAGKVVGDAAKDAGNTVGNMAKDAGDAMADAADAVKGAIMSVKLPGGAEIKTAAGSFTDKFVKMLGKKGKDAVAFDGVHFATGSANLTAESNAQLENLAAVLKAYPGVHIEISGHTDNTGDANKNLMLSTQRALAVRQKLQALGVAANRLSSKGYGQTKPIADNGTDQGRQENRRVDVRVTKY